jgi:hypothetical protein
MKKPSDYGQLNFRVSPDDKEELEVLIDEVLEILNKKNRDGNKKIKKNEVILKFLKSSLVKYIRKHK